MAAIRIKEVLGGAVVPPHVRAGMRNAVLPLASKEDLDKEKPSRLIQQVVVAKGGFLVRTSSAVRVFEGKDARVAAYLRICENYLLFSEEEATLLP